MDYTRIDAEMARIEARLFDHAERVSALEKVAEESKLRRVQLPVWAGTLVGAVVMVLLFIAQSVLAHFWGI